MTTISIIVPAYNVEKFIDEAISSILNQEFLPDEVIVVNDGSTDKTRDILRNYEHLACLKIVDTKNNGLGAARNIGLSKATSDYAYFFDSDDVLRSDFISSIKKILSLNKYDLVLFSGDVFFENSKLKNNFCPSYTRGFEGEFSKPDKLFEELYKHNSFFSSACLYVFNKSFWQNNGFQFKNIIHEDQEIIFQLYALSKNTFVINESFFLRRIREASIMTSSKSVKNLLGINEAIKSMYIFKQNYSELYKLLYTFWKKRLGSLTVNMIFLMFKSKKILISKYFLLSIPRVFTLERVKKLFFK